MCEEETDACVPCEVEDCDDGLFCNGIETCKGSVCIPGLPPCLGECSEESDVCPCEEDADCDDGMFCNGVETCLGAVCIPGPPPCAEGLCNEEHDFCSCSVDQDCDDGLFCNGPEDCMFGLCVHLPPPCSPELCDEDEDVCLPCSGDPDCDDGLFCNGAEACVEGVCTDGLPPCPVEVCDENTDSCPCVSSADCMSGDPCLVGECVGQTCEFNPRGQTGPPLEVGGILFPAGEAAFADAVAVVSGQIAPKCGASSLEEAVLGSDLNTSLSTPADSGEHSFDLYFIDNDITNGEGADAVIFETTNPNPLLVAVQVGVNQFSGEVQYLSQPTGEMVDCDGVPRSLNTILVDLDDFGLAAGTSVNVMRITLFEANNDHADVAAVGALNVTTCE
jgi:hypothetical protein